jgi:hypothetical protein
MTPSAPSMSVLRIAPDRSRSLRWTMRRLRAQTVRARLEAVIVCPSEAGLERPPPLAGAAGPRGGIAPPAAGAAPPTPAGRDARLFAGVGPTDGLGDQ